MRIKFTSGIFMWDAGERRQQRYGYFYADAKTFDENVKVERTFSMDDATALVGKKVKITVKVLESRKSGHCGNQYIDIYPSQPEVGEEVTLGVGILDVRPNELTKGLRDIGLLPDDDRDFYWVDPHNLYRLHDQTVEIYAEETDEPHHPAPNIKPVKPAGKAISNGDGTCQMVFVDWPEGKKARIKPHAVPIGRGLFSMDLPGEGNKG